jgi:hypothetical protein
MARRPFIPVPWNSRGCGVKATPHKRLISPRHRPGASWFTTATFSIFRYTMRIIPAILAGMFLTAMALFAGATASADSRVFVVANQADGYGIDQCLAQGEKCGAHAAHSYCRSRDFAQATAYRRIKPDEMTDSIPGSTGSCRHSGCNEYVAITCQR